MNASFGLTSGYEILCECAEAECARRVHETVLAGGDTYAVVASHRRSPRRRPPLEPQPAA